MIRYRTKDLELRLLRQILAVRHDGSHVAAAVAVVRGGPDGHDVFGGEVVFVAFVDELVRAGDELEIVYVVELYAQVSMIEV